MKSRRSLALLALLSLAGCTPAAQTRLARFEQTAHPKIVAACARFHRIEANPLLQVAIAGGVMLADVPTGGIAGPTVAALHSFGDAFCSLGPQPGDTTTPEQQAAWLDSQVTGQLQQLVGAR